MKVETDPNRIDKNKWNDFVFNHPKGNFFQTYEMYEVYKNTKNYYPVSVFVSNDKEEIKGLLLAVVQKERSGIIGILTARSIIFGGPLVENDNIEIFKMLIEKYSGIIKSKAIYSQFRNQWDFGKLKNEFLESGFDYEDHLNILVNLNKSEEELWKNVHSKRRNEIRRAKKEGTIFVQKETIQDLKECYSILESVYQRAKLPLPKFEFFKNLFNLSNEQLGIKLFCAEYNGKIIGCMIALVFKKVIYDFYAGSYYQYYKKYPNDLIPWEVFKWGKINGFTLFDFGGAGKPNVSYGVRDYKKKFGGEFVNFGRFEKIHKPLLFSMGKIAFKILRKVIS